MAFRVVAFAREEPVSETPDGKDPAYLDAVRALPCWICVEYGMTQTSPTEAHHCIHGRYSQKKVPDSMAIPLCNGHHTGSHDPDRSKIAIHKGKKTWAKLYGLDTDYILRTQERIEDHD